MLSKHSGESPGGIHAVEHPERVAQLVAQFWRGERVLLLRGQSIEETLHVVVMDEPSVLRLEELVQIERVFGLNAVDLHALRHLVLDDVGHLVGEHVKFRQILVRVAAFRIFPVSFGLLLVRVRPVVDRVLRELIVRDGLKRRSGQMQCVPAFDMVERHVRLVCVYTLVRLVDDKQVIVVFRHVLQLVVMAA